MQTRRELIAKRYQEAFSRLSEIEVPADRDYARHAWHLYIIKLNLEKISINRSEFIEQLKAENIGTSVHFIPVHLHPYYRETYGYKRGDLPQAEAVFDRIVSLPLFPKMSDQDVEDVIAAVQRIIEI